MFDGLKLVVVEDKVRRVPHLRLPRCRARTRSVRKAYDRVRRRHPVAYRTVVWRLEDFSGADCYQVGDTLCLSPRGMQAIRDHVAVKVCDRMAARLAAEAGPAAFVPGAPSTGGVTMESLREAMRKAPALAFDGRNLLSPRSLEMPPALPAHVFELPEGGPRHDFVSYSNRFIRPELNFASPGYVALLCSV